MKDKMLIKIERDRLKAEVNPKKENSGGLPSMDKNSQYEKTNLSNRTKFTPLPAEGSTTNPFLSKTYEPFNYKHTVLSKT